MLPFEVWSLICGFLPLKNLMGTFAVSKSFDAGRTLEWERRLRPDVRLAYVALAHMCAHGNPHAIDLLVSHWAFQRENEDLSDDDLWIPRRIIPFALYHCARKEQYALWDTMVADERCQRFEETVCKHTKLENYTTVKFYAWGDAHNRDAAYQAIEKAREEGDYSHEVYQQFLNGLLTKDLASMTLLCKEIVDSSVALEYYYIRHSLYIRGIYDDDEYVEGDGALLCARFGEEKAARIQESLLLRKDILDYRQQAFHFLQHPTLPEKPIFDTFLGQFADYDRDYGCLWNFDATGWYINRVVDKENVCKNVAKTGDLDLLVGVVAAGYPLHSNIYGEAARSGHLHILKYVHTQWGKCIYPTASSFVDAARGGHVECLRYLHQLFDASLCPWTVCACQGAASNGHLECLKYLHEHGCAWNSQTPSSAAACGRLDCLKYAHEQGCAWTSWTLYYAKQRKRWNCLRYACENACPGYENYSNYVK